MYDYDRRTAFLTRDTVKRIYKLVTDVVKGADAFLRSIQFGTSKSDPGEIQRAAKDLAPIAQWAPRRQELESEPLARFAKYTGDLAKMTEFWNRPAFLGKDDYARKVQALVAKIHKAHQDLVQALRQSQKMQAVR